MKNIYTRIGEVLDNISVDSVLAYNNDEEEVLKGAGFTRTGSVTIDDEIVDVYKRIEKRNIVVIDDKGWTLKDLENFRIEHHIGLGSGDDNFAYLEKWNTKF
ncbi:hypothetical protein [Escherichia phage vB_EcoM_JNE01]|nr:hypothetical protein [Escherichia phage vB_EcoM_JNE01]